MTAKSNQTRSTAALMIRFHLADGSVQTFSQADTEASSRFLKSIDPVKLFIRPRIVVGSEHSKTVFITSEIVRVDFVHDGFQCWNFPAGYSDIVELSEVEFRKSVHLDEPRLREKRERTTPTGDLLISFTNLGMRGGRSLFVMVEFPNKLPAESQSFMHFMLSKSAVHMRLGSGGIGVLNLANLITYTVYPGVSQIPTDAWVAEPEGTSL